MPDRAYTSSGTTISGLAYYEVDFNADGSLNTATGGGDGALPAAVRAGGITDVFVLSHGWNNGVDSARDLYQAMFGLLAAQLGARLSTSAAVGVIWPSVVFPDDDPATAPPVPSTGAQLAAALSPAFTGQQQHLATMGRLLDQQPQDPAALVQFHNLAKGLVTTPPQAIEDTGEAALLSADTAAAFGHAAAMASQARLPTAEMGNPFTGLWTGAREVLRILSYYEMKNRAGVVGQLGLGPLLAGLTGRTGAPRIHLIGHSFGARLVAYSLAGLHVHQIGAASPVKSLTLIQGAFSHFAFAPQLIFDPSRPGGLTGYSDRVDGPLLATFTAADRALGWWYPMASELAGQDSESATDLVYQWGAMGHDGYQQSPAPAAVVMQPQGKPYDFQSGTFYNLDANAVITSIQSPFSGAHSDIRHPEVLWAVVSAAGIREGWRGTGADTNIPDSVQPSEGIRSVLNGYIEGWTRLFPRMYVSEVERLATMAAGDNRELGWLTALLPTLLSLPHRSDPTYGAQFILEPDNLGLLDRLQALARDALMDESIELDRLADRLEASAVEDVNRQLGVATASAATHDDQVTPENPDQSFSVTADLLDFNEDPMGAISWWLTHNIWLGQPPLISAREGREAEVRFAAQQLFGDSW